MKNIDRFRGKYEFEEADAELDSIFGRKVERLRAASKTVSYSEDTIPFLQRDIMHVRGVVQTRANVEVLCKR